MLSKPDFVIRANTIFPTTHSTSKIKTFGPNHLYHEYWLVLQANTSITQ